MRILYAKKERGKEMRTDPRIRIGEKKMKGKQKEIYECIKERGRIVSTKELVEKIYRGEEYNANTMRKINKAIVEINDKIIGEGIIIKNKKRQGYYIEKIGE